VKYYIFTVPKAGTYLLAKTLQSLGLNDSGYHVGIHSYLDTHSISLEENILEPSKSEKNKAFVTVLEQLEEGSVCFGHLSPIYFPLPILKKFGIVYSIRNPKEVLVSEFIDFRFRRKDVHRWYSDVSKRVTNDHQEAFIKYLTIQIPIIEEIFTSYYQFKGRLVDLAYRSYLTNPAVEILFNDFLDMQKGPLILKKLVKTFQLDIDKDADFNKLHRNILESENKTKAVGIEYINRKELWNEEAIRLYKNSSLPKFELLVSETCY
jgi:hypothetical protein